MNLNLILSDIRNISTSGANPENFRIEDNQILYWIDEIRSMLITQALQKKPDIDDNWLQTIKCLDLIQVDKSECCEVSTGCMVLRSELEIPSTYIDIIRVEDNMGNTLSRTSAFEAKYNDFTKYGKLKAKWFYKDGFIYVLNTDFLSHINIIGIWERPQDLADYITCDGNTCYSITGNDYPCSLKMASDITNIIIKTKVFPFLQLPRDTTNDDSNNNNQPLPTNTTNR